MYLPSPPLLRAYAVRGLGFWTGARAMLALFALLSVGPGAAWNSLVQGVPAAPAAVPVAVLLGTIDTHWWGQQTLLANLGASRRTHAAMVALAALIGEGALWMLTWPARLA